MTDLPENYTMNFDTWSASYRDGKWFTVVTPHDSVWRERNLTDHMDVWYWHDETGDTYGPYTSRFEAKWTLHRYCCEWLEGRSVWHWKSMIELWRLFS